MLQSVYCNVVLFTYILYYGGCSVVWYCSTIIMYFVLQNMYILLMYCCIIVALHYCMVIHVYCTKVLLYYHCTLESL